MKDGEHPIFSSSWIGRVSIFKCLRDSGFLRAGYIWVKMCLPIVIFLGGMLLALLGMGPPR